jgi:hypothetical protein
MVLPPGSTDVTVEVYARDAATGQPRTGLIAANIAARFVRTRGATQNLPLVALASTHTAHADGGFIEIDAEHCPGWYRLDLPDATVAEGASSVTMVLQASGVMFDAVRVQLSKVAAEVHLCKAALINRRVHTVSTGVDEIFDDDGVTRLVRLVPTDGGDDQVVIVVE